MAVSMAGILPNRFFKWHTGHQESAEDWEEKDLFIADDGPTVNHVISNFYFPHYDDAGKETFTLRGKKAMLINNKLYKIESPEVSLKGGLNSVAQTNSPNPNEDKKSDSGGESGEHSNIIITSRTGQLDKDTKEGLLTKGVTIAFGEGTTIKTDVLRYYPKENKAKTDSPVLLQGEKMKIRGEGMEAELTTGHIWFEREIVAELEGVSVNLTLSSFGGSPYTIQTKAEEKTTIRCSGKLVYEKQTNMLTFHNEVRVRQGISTLFTDKLILVFDEKGRKTKILTAEGDILASDGKRVAKGRSLFWDAVTDTIILEDIPSAEFFDESFTLIASKVIFSQGGQQTEAPKGGQLHAKGAPKAKGGTKPDQDWEGVNITWKGKMTFQREIEQATFTEDVRLTRKDSTIYCQKMIMNFEGIEMKLKTMEASGGVYIVENSGGLLREVKGQEGYWDFGKDVAELKGEGNLFMQTAPGQVKEEGLKINWDQKMTVQDAKKKIVFYENVRAVKGLQKLDCNQLTTFIGENSKLEKVVGLGDVFFVDGRDGGIESVGDTMEWDYISNKVVISGEPNAEARRKTIRTFAKRIYYDLKTQQMGWKERPRLEIPDERKETSAPVGLHQLFMKGKPAK
ncbi:MAG TPA: LPS export ABC transporter periplasmic protein LptC [Candidatus Hypogeohydataceae bacterium YC40]